jgi:carboxymethylenebutenolidase
MNDDRQASGHDSNADDFSRREFVALSIAAGVAAATTTAARGADLPVTESDVMVKTPDGTCDAAFIHPTTGKHPGVLIWPDAFGLRPSMRDIGKRIAAAGYSVLVPNPFYRTAKAPVFADASKFNFANQDDRAKLQPLMGPLNAAGNAEKDAAAYIAFLDAQPQVDKTKKIGTQGYCMGGPLVMRTAATSTRIGAGGSFHGGGLVTNNPNSPHLLAPKIHARMYFGVAKNDDERQPDAKDKLKAALDAAHVANKIEVYPANHGWCMPDMPAPANAPIYSKPDAERAWGELLALYKQALA